MFLPGWRRHLESSCMWRPRQVCVGNLGPSISMVFLQKSSNRGDTAIAKHADRSGHSVRNGGRTVSISYDGVFLIFSAIRFTQTAGLNVWFLVVVLTNIQSNFEWDRVTMLRENCFRVDTRVELIVREKSALDNDPCACFEVNKVNSKFSVHNLPLEITVCDQQVQIYRSFLFLTARFPYTSRVIWGIFLSQHGPFCHICPALLFVTL